MYINDYELNFVFFPFIIIFSVDYKFIFIAGNTADWKTSFVSLKK